MVLFLHYTICLIFLHKGLFHHTSSMWLFILLLPHILYPIQALCLQAYKSPSPWSPEAKGLVHLQTPLGLLGLTFVPSVYIWFLFGCDHKLNRVKGKNSREPISCCQPELKRERLFFPSIFNVLTATCCLVSQTPRVVLISLQVDSVEPPTYGIDGRWGNPCGNYRIPEGRVLHEALAFLL